MRQACLGMIVGTICATLLGACATMQGVGRDVQAAGRGLESLAREVGDELSD